MINGTIDLMVTKKNSISSIAKSNCILVTQKHHCSVARLIGIVHVKAQFADASGLQERPQIIEFVKEKKKSDKFRVDFVSKDYRIQNDVSENGQRKSLVEYAWNASYRYSGNIYCEEKCIWFLKILKFLGPATEDMIHNQSNLMGLLFSDLLSVFSHFDATIATNFRSIGQWKLCNIFLIVDYKIQW